ncbi:unnamed protein product [Blepharisma stoltei]|uniref:Uncharacterized protein n=1 Tax=Blepharisma stoltei TaxID=1481888 RepID=A0AAU9K923_9CILI|nr:unnamed protein product [Blepharisma stoltei]
MLNLRALIRFFSSRNGILPPGLSKQRSIIEFELKKVRNPESFISILKDTHWSPHQQIYGILLFNKWFDKHDINTFIIKEYHHVIEMILSDIQNLDYQAVIDLANLISNSTGWRERYLNTENIESLRFRIHELIESNCYNKTQLISIHKALKNLKFNVENLSQEIEKILKNPAIQLSLQEIADIVVGLDLKLMMSRKHLFGPVLDRVIDIKIENFDSQSALTILSFFKKIDFGAEFESILLKYVGILETKMTNWSEYELLEAAKCYSKIKIMPSAKSNRLWNNIIEVLLKKGNKTDLSFLIEILKNSEIAKEKLVKLALSLVFPKLERRLIRTEDLLPILESSKKTPLSSVNSEFLKKLLESLPFYNELVLFEAINHISFIKFSKLGYISSFSSVLNFDKILNFDKNSLSRLPYDQKFIILDKIFTTHPSLRPILMPWSDFLIENISQEISDPHRLFQMLAKIRKISTIPNETYISSATFKELKPIQEKVYKFLDFKLAEKKFYKGVLLFSSIFYESDPSAWVYFIEKNKLMINDQDEIHQTVKFTNAPFEKINLLLEKYDIYTPNIIRSAVLRLQGSTDKEFSDFLTHINNIHADNFTIQPTSFIDWHLFWKICRENKTSLISDLLDKISMKMMNLPYSKQNIDTAISIANILSNAGKLTKEYANKLIKELDPKLALKKELIIPIILESSNEELKVLLFEEILNSKINSSQFINIIEFILQRPRQENIENIVTQNIWNIIKNYSVDDIILILSSRELFENYKTEHSGLVHLMLSKCSEVMKHKPIYLHHISNIFSILPYDWQNIISPNSIIKKLLQSNESLKIGSWNQKFIQKMTNSGYKDDLISQILFNSKNTQDQQFFPDCLSYIADFRLEEDPLAVVTHSRIMAATEKDQIVFDSNLATVKYCYGLIRCGGKEAEIKRHLTNAKQYEEENLTFKHVLIDNHLALNHPDWGLHQEYPNFGFNYLSYFGIEPELMNRYKMIFQSQGVRVGEFVNNVWVPLFIPLRQIALWPISNFIFFYQTKDLKGEFHMYKTQLSQVCKKVVFLPKNVGKDFKIHEFLEKPSI